MAPRGKRDTTRALQIVIALISELTDALASLKQILTDVDARTGRRDPSKRTPRKRSSAKKAAT